jgi:hypothetical protein
MCVGRSVGIGGNEIVEIKVFYAILGDPAISYTPPACRNEKWIKYQIIDIE